MYYLENVHIASDHNFIDTRFPVQYVIRPYQDEFHDYRGYAGRVAGGILKKGDKVICLPSGFSSTIKKIDTIEGELKEAFPPQSVTILLEDDIDISRGDMIVRENNQPEATQDLEVMVCWFNEKPLREKGKYTVLHTTQEARCVIKEISYRLNINTLHRDLENKEIKMNDIARVVIRTTKPLFVDEGTNETVGAGMIK